MFQYVGTALVFYIVARFLFSIYSTQRHAAKARALGCVDPPTVPRLWYDPWNFHLIRKLLAAASEGLLWNVFTDRHAEMCRLTGRNCKTYAQTALGSDAIDTHEPENIKAVLATQFNDFMLGKRIPVFKPLLGNGIFAADGKSWEHSRSMLRPSFARERVSDLELEDRHNQNLHKALPVNPYDGWSQTVDLQPLFFRLTIDSSTEFLFGESVDSQLAALPGTQAKPSRKNEIDFTYNFDRAQELLGTRGRVNDFYWLINTREFRRTIKGCHDFIDYYVDLALHPPQSSTEKLATSAKGQYIFLEELAQQVRDPIMLRDELINVLLAGRDTTASLLGWLFLSLARNPAIYAKLRSAVLESFGPYNASNEVSFRALKECNYLQYCLNEALRLYPVVPLNARTAARDTTLPRGGGPEGKDPVYVKKGNAVVYSVFVLHRNKELWGDDADVFRPERWEGRRHGWEYLPFNGGPRICLGQQFALTSAGYCTLRMLQRFDKIENCDEDPMIRYDQSLTMKSKNGVKVRLHEAAPGQ